MEWPSFPRSRTLHECLGHVFLIEEHTPGQLVSGPAVMILLVPTFKVSSAVFSPCFYQPHCIPPKPQVSFEIKTADFDVSESPNTHSCALLYSSTAMPLISTIC